jgi:hypothetical protein
MDIFSHGLWAGALAEGLNQSHRLPKNKVGRLHFGWTVWWGLFPDLFAFALPFTFLIFHQLTGYGPDFQFPAQEPVPAFQAKIFQLVSIQYGMSHSLVVFAFVFGIIVLLRGKRRVPWEMLGWCLHILMDIPTHSYRFYPTPFLWPISMIKFNGFSWATPWFIITDYSLLIIVYLYLGYRRWKKHA